MIRFEQVAKTFATYRGTTPTTALTDISFEVAPRAIVGIIGRSGAGKSTLIRLVNGLEQPSGGRVVVAGQDIATLRGAGLRRQRRHIGMIFQHFNLLSSRTVTGNVALPLELAGTDAKSIRRRTGELLDLVGLSDKRDRYPVELSGGQKQRVGIARALACGPEILLSDEATSALDPETTASILELLRGINAELGLTILLITHEMSVVRAVCHRVGVLDAGRLVEEGPVAQVLSRPRAEATRALLAAADAGSDPDALFMCELYCASDAIYVAPECDRPVPVDPEAIVASGLLGGFRRDSGWGEWRDDPRYPNLHWRMDEIFKRARGAVSRDGGGNPVRPLPPQQMEGPP